MKNVEVSINFMFLRIIHIPIPQIYAERIPS